MIQPNNNDESTHLEELTEEQLSQITGGSVSLLVDSGKTTQVETKFTQKDLAQFALELGLNLNDYLDT